MAESNSKTTGTETQEKETNSSSQHNMGFQKSEVTRVKQMFNGQCRILQNIGEYLHVVTVQPKDLDLTIKFQLPETYPTGSPDIIIKSSSMSDDEAEGLKDYLLGRANGIAGTAVIQVLVEEAVKWLKEEEVDVSGGKSSKNTSSKNDGKYRKDMQKRRKRKEKAEAEEVEDEKKPSMKTADDVVKRILWDMNLPRDQFLVGYIDRFVGIQEKYFTAFSWEDLASVDYTVLAIPKHRIQYFKYKDVIVWDKNKRLDNVFGSLGSKTTIYDVIENYEREKKAKQEEQDNDVTQETTTEKAEPHENGDDDDSDSDDGITVTIGGACANASQTTGTDNYLLSDDDDDDLDDGDGYNKYWRNKMRPNHFLALRIDSDDVKKTAEGIQDIILEHEPQYETCCIPPKSLHITLCTLGLDTPEQVAHASQVLQKIKPELINIVPKDKILTLKGIEQFFNRVLYAKVQCPPEFIKLVDHIKLCLQNEGIEVRDNHDFVPHMTVMKITRTVARGTGKKYIAPWLYSSKMEVDFGTQAVDNIFLCEMGINRREDGFYMSPCELHW